MKYRIISLASEDLAGAVKYHEAQCEGLGADFLDEFENQPSINFLSFDANFPH